MASGKGLGRFAARKSNPDSGGGDIPSPPVEAPRPSIAGSFASFDESRSLHETSSEFNPASDFDGGNFEDHFGGDFEGENFDHYNDGSNFDGGNFDDEPHDGILQDISKENNDPTETSNSLEEISKEGATEAVPEESSNTIQTNHTLSETFHRILPPLPVVPSQTTPPIDAHTIHSQRMINASSVIPSQGPASGIKMFGRPLLSNSAVVPPPPHPVSNEVRRPPQNGSIQGYKGNESLMNPLDNRPGSRISQNGAKQFAQTHAQVGGGVGGGATNAEKCGLTSTSTVLQRGAVLNRRPEVFQHRPADQDLTSTPSPCLQTPHSSNEDDTQRSFSRVTPDSASTTPGTVSYPEDLLRLSTTFELQSPMAKSNPEHKLGDAIDHLACSGEEFENLVSSFLADLQEAEDLWDRGEYEILALNVDMSETYATTLRVRGQLMDILDEIDQGLALQDEVISELQAILHDK